MEVHRPFGQEIGGDNYKPALSLEQETVLATEKVAFAFVRKIVS